MKLRNKKTGEIREIKEILIDGMFSVDSLAELNAEWEDYEEHTFFMINAIGTVSEMKLSWLSVEPQLKDFGNYFENEEEAELVLAKLYALKRLKDKGLRFSHYVIDHDKKCAKVIVKADDFDVPFDEAKQFYDDFGLVFGGEE